MLKLRFALSTLALCAACSSTPPAQSPESPEAAFAGDADEAESGDLGRGVDAIEKGDFAGAREIFRSIADDEPSNDKAHFYLGVAEQNLGNADGAAASYEKALELNAGLVEASVNLSALYLDGERYAQALPVIDRGLAKHPDHPGLTYNRALALSGSGQHGEAVAAFRKALAADPQNVEVKYGYAEALVSAGSTDTALGVLNELAQTNDVAVLASTARLLGRMKRFDACIVTLDKALTQKPSSELFVDRGLCHHGKKDDARAFEDFQAAVETDASYAPGHYYSGMHLKMVGKKSEARAALTRAAEIAGDAGVGKAARRALESL